MIGNKTFISVWIVFSLLLFENCSPVSKYVYWEDYSTVVQTKIINNTSINELARLIYKGEATISDNVESFQLLEDITSFSHSDEINAFYYYVWGIICHSSDGAVAETLGYFCLNEMINATEYNLQYFVRDVTLMQKYAEYIGFELYLNPNAYIKLDLIKEQIGSIISTNVKIKEMSLCFLDLIDENYSIITE